MDLRYCDRCSVRIAQAELDEGHAVQTDGKYVCNKCRKPSAELLPPKSGIQSAAHRGPPSVRKIPVTTATKTPAMLYAAAGGGALLLVMLLFAASSSSTPTPPAKTPD